MERSRGEHGLRGSSNESVTEMLVGRLGEALGLDFICPGIGNNQNILIRAKQGRHKEISVFKEVSLWLCAVSSE